MKKILRRTGLALLIFLILDILLLTGLYLFHRFRLRQEAPLRQHTVGTPVNVDGGKMNVYTEGEGPHTFVFMSGFGTASPVYDFKPLYTKLSTDNRIAVVEKFGYGFSDDSGSPRDIKTMLSQTRAALTAAGIEAPYVLVPHSASGMEALCWAQQYPEEVEAITASDIVVPGAFELQDMSLTADRIMAAAARIGITRLLDIRQIEPCMQSDALTDAEKETVAALSYARKNNPTVMREAYSCVTNMNTVAAGGVPDVPMLFFISDGYLPEQRAAWHDLPRRYTNNGAEYIDLTCGHYCHVEEADRMNTEIRRFLSELKGDTE